jgi:pseudaminic acid cytidylyltransferase
MNVAMIPARGGSKRIPRKNIKNFLGKPIIAYSIEAAKASGCFDKIIVSTDDEEIAAVARQYGAETPFLRPKDISDDYATTVDVINHSINWLLENNIAVENICCIYATAPFVEADDLISGLTAIQDNRFLFAFSATSYAFPIQRAIKVNKDGAVDMFNSEYMNTRSQDLEEAYHDAGQFYWGKAKAFLDGKPIFSPAAFAVKLPRKRVQDIDTPEDWDAAEIAFKLLAEKG